MGSYGWTDEDLARHLAKLGRQAFGMPMKAVSSLPEPRSGAPAQSKFFNRKVTYEGFLFDSERECQRYHDLKLLLKVGAIRDLELQPEYELIASNGEIIGKFTPDFRYWSLELGKLVVEDVKAKEVTLKNGRKKSYTKTEAYRLRKRLLRACHGIEIVEI